ncbi:MAG TPA: paraquat-inducible protein A [Usitatibacter sp.]|nr:paraquat-inducible protein A [Usitatibacter sp.]
MTPTAARHAMWLCQSCGQLNRAPAAGHVACARCSAPLHARKPHSIVRSLMLLALASALYIPANTLPVIESGSIFGFKNDTILSGAIYLWRTGSWGLAVIIFTASIVIPLAKLLVVGFLLALAQRRSRWNPRRRTQLHRLMSLIGRWSMVDIFVGAMLVALVQFKTVAQIHPGPGAIAFGAVVVLTMLASLSYDPRLTWDPVDDFHA